jgi:hypothetical protein
VSGCLKVWGFDEAEEEEEEEEEEEAAEAAEERYERESLSEMIPLGSLRETMDFSVLDHLESLEESETVCRC